MTDDLFHEDLSGHIYRQTNVAEDEPLYIMKIYGFDGVDHAEVVRCWTKIIMEREGSVSGREVNVQVWIRGRVGYGRKSVSVRQNYIQNGDPWNLVKSVVGEVSADVAQVRLSFFRPKMKKKVTPTTKEILTQVTGTLQRIESRQQEQLKLLLQQGMNYRQAAHQIGINEMDAFELVSKWQN